jgi:hypothetical protein
MWSIFPAAAILLAQAQLDPAEKWCFERGQNGAQLCEDNERACNDLRRINTEIATGPCLRLEPRGELSGSTAALPSSEKRTLSKP